MTFHYPVPVTNRRGALELTVDEDRAARYGRCVECNRGFILRSHARKPTVGDHKCPYCLKSLHVTSSQLRPIAWVSLVERTFYTVADHWTATPRKPFCCPKPRKKVARP